MGIQEMIVAVIVAIAVGFIVRCYIWKSKSAKKSCESNCGKCGGCG